MKYQWREQEHYYYYFRVEDGLLMGMVFKYANQNVIWLAKVYKMMEEKLIGQYVGMEYAKKAIEIFWSKQDNTLTYEGVIE